MLSVADCPNCRIPLTLPSEPNGGEIDCPVCTLALYYVHWPADDGSRIYLIKRGHMPVSDWDSVQQSLSEGDSISIFDAVMILDEYRDQ